MQAVLPPCIFFATAELMFASKQDRLAQGDKDDNRIPAGGTPGWEVMHIYMQDINYQNCN